MLCACSAFLIYLDLRWNSEIRRCHHPSLSLRRVEERLSIFMIEKREPADYEPLHSAGITYPSYGLRNGLTIHTSFHIIYSFVFPSPMGLLASREGVPIQRARCSSRYIRSCSLTLTRMWIVGSSLFRFVGLQHRNTFNWAKPWLQINQLIIYPVKTRRISKS